MGASSRDAPHATSDLPDGPLRRPDVDRRQSSPDTQWRLLPAYPRRAAKGAPICAGRAATGAATGAALGLDDEVGPVARRRIDVFIGGVADRVADLVVVLL